MYSLEFHDHSYLMEFFPIHKVVFVNKRGNVIARWVYMVHGLGTGGGGTGTKQRASIHCTSRGHMLTPNT